MAEHITLDTLMQSSGHTALQVQEPASVEAVRAQVEELSPEQRVRVEEVKNSIDLIDSQAVLQYGVGAQRNISSFSDNILTQVRSKDSGYVGELMSDLVLKVKEVDVDGLDEGFLDKLPFLKNASRAVKKFMQRYEKLEVQIDRIEQQLDQARMQMLKDITMFDGLYEKNLNTSGSCKFTSPQAKKAEGIAGNHPTAAPRRSDGQGRRHERPGSAGFRGHGKPL